MSFAIVTKNVVPAKVSATDNRQKIMSSSIFGEPPQNNTVSRAPQEYSNYQPTRYVPQPSIEISQFDFPSSTIDNVDIEFRAKKYPKYSAHKRLEVNTSNDMKKLRDDLAQDSHVLAKRLRKITEES